MPVRCIGRRRAPACLSGRVSTCEPRLPSAIRPTEWGGGGEGALDTVRGVGRAGDPPGDRNAPSPMSLGKANRRSAQFLMRCGAGGWCLGGCPATCCPSAAAVLPHSALLEHVQHRLCHCVCLRRARTNNALVRATGGADSLTFSAFTAVLKRGVGGSPTICPVPPPPQCSRQAVPRGDTRA